MKFIKVCGLAVFAAMALTAWLGVGSASAATMCKVNQTPCPEASRWPSGTKFVAESTEVVIGGSLSVQCKVKVEFTLDATSGNPLTATANAILWISCKGGCVKVETTKLPAWRIAAAIAGGGRGIFTLLAMNVKLGSCLGFFTCTMSVAEGKQEFTGGSGGSAAFTQNNIPVTFSGFGCGTEGVMNAGGGSGGTPFIMTTANGSSSFSVFVSQEP